MRFKRSQRVQELLLEEISRMLQSGLKDPRITGFITVTDVDLGDNLRHAKVYVSIMADEKEVESTLEGLRSATGFIRSSLGKNLYLKYVPELEFKLDNTASRVEKISRIINELHTE